MSDTMQSYPVLTHSPLSKDAVQPYMNDYESLRANFQWDDVLKELRLPRANGINKASICLDDHPTDVMKKDALIWVATNGQEERYTFNDLKAKTNQFANVLSKLGVKKGERVFVYLERIPEIYITLFGALKIGAVVGPLFSAFGPEAIRDRLADSEATTLIISPALKPRLEEIRAELPSLKHVIVVDRDKSEWDKKPGDHLYSDLMKDASDKFDVVKTDADDYSIIHYTSGTTGKPKGAAHRHYAILAQYTTTKYILDLHPSDIYWCTADPGWVTGTSYGMFGPWSNGATMLVYEGPFNAEHWYKIIEKYKVTVWYTAPTAIRMLMKAGDEVVKKHDLSSLRHLASVGEPLNPEAVVWGHEVFGHIFHDTWWQTETGAMQICNYPCMNVKPGSMGKPFLGVEAGILDEDGNTLPKGEEGHLAIRPGGPSFFRTYWNKDEMYQSRFRNGWYLTGDRAVQDKDGYFWFIGRADDVINTAGHLVGPFEVESALIEHPAVAEAGVIGKPDPERLEIVKAFISLKEGFQASDELIHEIQQFVRKRLAAHAYPREIEIINNLPKTRSGKIMRRLLKSRELGLPEGDTSTLED